MHFVRTSTIVAVTFLGLAACSESGKVRGTQVQAVVGSEVNLGHPFLGDRAKATFPITALGEGVFRVKRISTAHPQLTLDWGDHAGGVSVARGSTLDVKVSWLPFEAGIIDANIEVELDLDDAPNRTVHVTGEARAVPSCDDGNQCTDDAFDRVAESCVHSDHEGACNDGNACTEDDRCMAGTCRGLAKTCNDDNVCTLDLCDPTSGCLFPPDNRQCDDKDPCTTDVCDPDDGCSHPDAPAGTACGDFSCSTAHVCVFGTCRELDITDSSDGFPCSDGNACTEGDACLAGQCHSGPPRADSGPEIVAALDTYGGENAYAATDGYRYLFVDRRTTPVSMPVTDPTALRITTWDGTALTPRGGLPILANASPVSVAPGLFAVPSTDRIYLIDATDPDAPTIAWSYSRMTTSRATMEQLAMVDAGLLIRMSVDTVTGTSPRSYVYLMPNITTAGPSNLLPLFDDDLITEIDGDEDTLAIVATKGVYWQRLAADGTVAEQEYVMPGQSARVSVQRRNVAILLGGQIQIIHTGMGGALLATARGDSAADVALVGDTLFTTGGAGTWARTLDELIHHTPGHPDGPVIDSMGGTDLERTAGHVILRGPLALPLKLIGGTNLVRPSAARVTGVGHGSLARTTPTSNRTLLAGSSTALAEINLTTLSFASWSLLPYDHRGNQMVLLKGAGETVSVDSQVWVSNSGLSSCDGPVWNRYTSPTQSQQAQQSQLCGLIGGTVAVTPDRIWATAVFSRPQPYDPSYDKYCLRMWNLNPFNAMPVFEVPDIGNVESMSVRASQDQRYVGWATDIIDSLATQRPVVPRLRLIRSDSSALTVVGEFAYEENEPYVAALPETYAVTADSALTAGSGVVRLHPLTTLSTGAPPTLPDGSLPTISLADSMSFNRVLYMDDGRAWIGWEKDLPASGPMNRLSQLRYDPYRSTLEDLGEVALPGHATSAQQVEDYTVVTTPTAVLLVAPSCR